MYKSAVALLAAAAPFVSARAIHRRDGSKYENAVYWGANSNQRDLADYCQSGQGIDILILSFLGTFGNGKYPSGTFNQCTINSDQTFSDCDGLASDIATCQAAGIKVFVSLGGADADNTWALTGSADAQGVASSLWNSYGAASAAANGSARPFGNVSIDGWDFDLESQGGQGYPDSYKYLGDLVNSLRGYFANDTSNHTYYISGAPQCPTPDANLGMAIQSSQFDYLFIQFYNNDCAANDLFSDPNNNPDGAGSFNLASWPDTIANGSSSKAYLHVGLPGDKSEAGDYFYVDSSNLASLFNTSSQVAGFHGAMIFDAGDSDTVNVTGQNYAQLVKAALNNLG